MSKSSKAIVIGSGVAGLAVAIRLAAQGFLVTVYEKNSYAGGKISLIETDGYVFDAGPSLFTEPANIEELFKLCNEPIEDYITWQQVPVACKYFYEDGTVVTAFTSKDKLYQELQDKLQEEPGNIKAYLDQSASLYNSIGKIFVDHSLHKAKTWLSSKIVNAIRKVKIAYLFNNLHSYNSKHFRSPKTIQLFDRFATYNGSNPYKAPAMLSLIPHLEMNTGTFYPKGGMISIAKALHQLALKKGVQFNFNSPVESIVQNKDKVNGVVVNGKHHYADVVISNVDIYFTYSKLLHKPQAAAKVLKQERSSSAIIFYWGINKTHRQLDLHNIFFSENYKEEFDHLFAGQEPYHDPTIYINITSKMENDMAPDECENWFILINAPANTGQDWASIKQTLRQQVIQKLSRMLGENIEPFIATEQSSDPLMIEEQTASFMGSLYGTSSNSKMAAFLRHPNFKSSMKGLYFCGGSVHPGGGIPLCLKSAAIVSNLIQADIN